LLSFKTAIGIILRSFQETSSLKQSNSLPNY